MRVLIVEDDAKIAAYVARALREAGHAVDVALDGTEGLELGMTGVYDAAVVDVMLPGVDGISLIEKLRAAQVATPVLFLSAKDAVGDRIRGLRAGGDDYVTKPFSIAEVLARVEALIRRATRTTEPTSLSCGDLTADLLARDVRRAGKRIELQPREFALLELLLRNQGRVLSRMAILEHVYDYRFDPQTNVVDVLVSRLRAKVDREFDHKMIHTVRGVGYALRP